MSTETGETGIVRIGVCYSGLLFGKRATHEHRRIQDYPNILRRVAIATPRAFEHLDNDLLLLESLSAELENTGKIEPAIIRTHGLWPRLYEGRSGWTTIGLRFFNPPAEESAPFLEAARLIQSTSRGVHRKLYMAMHGVQAEGIENITPDLYQAALARLFRLFADPKHERLRFLSISRENRFDIVEENSLGEMAVVLADEQLKTETERYQPNIERKGMEFVKVDGKWRLQ